MGSRLAMKLISVLSIALILLAVDMAGQVAS
jgi:hypothetical protein